MNKLKMESLDMTQKNIDKIVELFPQVVTEVLDPNMAKDADGKSMLKKAIDFEKLKLVLSAGIGDYVVADDERERYEFTWVGKRQAMIDAATPIRKTLRPFPEESKDWATTKNLYIEGDNLEVLKLLQESYLGKVKMIYIDPPYNTGKDFIYKDNFTQSREEYEEELDMFDEEGNRLFQNTETNGRFHSDWCSMIYPRLQLARNLLTDDGVIFVSIDDNEVENLKKIASEVFGEDNFVGQWNWFKSATPPNLSHKVKKNIEYLIAFEKNRSGIIYSGIKKFSPSDDPMTKPQNSIKILRFAPNTINFKLRNQTIHKGVYGTEKYPNELLNDLVIENGKNKNEVRFSNRFIWLQEKLEEELEKRTVMNCSKSLVLSYKKNDYSPEVPPNLIDSSVGVDTTEEAGKQLAGLVGDKVFDYPKPISLIKYLIGFKDNDLILDFFSGSASTAHAVMQLNAEDGGNRKFIMIQLPEVCNPNSEAAKAGYKNICEIGKERIRRAGDKIVKDRLNRINKEAEKEDLLIDPSSLDIGFRVFKLDTTNMKDVYYAAGELSQADLFDAVSNIKDDRSDIDLLYGCLLDWGVYEGLQLHHTTETIDGYQVHTVDDKRTDFIDLIACFDEKISEETVRTIAARKPLRAVFRDSSFTDSAEKINVTEIFKAISPDTTVKVM